MINLLKSILGLKVTNNLSLNIAGSGKAMPVNTLVKVPGGWKALGELSVGSEVIGPKGNVAQVIEVLPQGITDCYKFIFEDGRTAESHPLHLWEVFEGSGAFPFTTTTQDIVAHFNEFQYSIPLVGQISGSESRLDEAAIKELVTLLLNERSTVNKEIQELHYLDRYAIARTMRAFEGCVASNGVVRFITEKEQSAINFQQITWSVGGIANLEKLDNSYVVTAKHQQIEDQDAINAMEAGRLDIVGIEKEHPAETICINIDSADKLFVVEDWIVTHNLCID